MSSQKLRPVLFALGLFAATAARADILSFDDQAAGTAVTAQYPGVTVEAGPVISTHTVSVSKFNVLAQVEPATATVLDGDGPVRLDFSAPKSRVRVRAGFALAPSSTKTGPATITMTAWGYDNKTSTWYVAAVDTKTAAGPDLFAAMEICRPLSNDILRVDIEAAGSRIEIIDNFEFLDYSGAPRWTADFDNVPAGTIITGTYPGVNFTTPAATVTAASVFTTAASGTQVARPYGNAESHPEPFAFDLVPPQGAVKLRIGNSGSPVTPLTVRVTALNSAGVELARVERSYPGAQGITDPVEICRWDQRDIARVSLLYLTVGGVPRQQAGEECFDALEYGPLDPASLTDVTRPEVFISNPTVVDATLTMEHKADVARAFPLTIHAFENVGLAAMWTTQENMATGAVTTEPLYFSVLGRLPVYTPPGGAPVTVPDGQAIYSATALFSVTPGQWRFRIFARDTAGNVSVVSSSNERLRSLVPLPASTYTPNAEVITFMGTAADPLSGAPWTPAGLLRTDYVLFGTNLHRDSQVVFVREN